jgi:hypothetical protein
VKRLIDEQRLDRDRTALVDDTKDYLDAAKQNGISFIFASYGYGKLDQKDYLDLRVQTISASPELVNFAIFDDKIISVSSCPRSEYEQTERQIREQEDDEDPGAGRGCHLVITHAEFGFGVFKV